MPDPATSQPPYTPDQINQLKARVDAVLDKLRPAIRGDGGDIDLIDVTPEGIAVVELSGHCVGCSLSPMTMKLGVERMILEEIPEIKGVEHAY